MLPSSIIGGFVGLICGPFIFNLIPIWIIKNWAVTPGLFINIVFATLFLGISIPGFKKIWNTGGPMLCFGIIMGVGQYLIAMLAVTLILAPLFGVPNIFSCILEIGFSGGHGTAAGMTELFNKLNFPAGGALSQMSATVGIIFAVVGGIIIINITHQKNSKVTKKENVIPKYKKIGLLPENKRYCSSTATVASESIEPFIFHFSFIGMAILIGWIILYLLKIVSPLFHSFPLFPLAMIGGLIIQKTSDKFKISHYFDKQTFDRIMGFSLDILVASAIASIRFDLFIQNIWPFIILMICGILWLLFMVIYTAPRMFPEHYFERSITEFGMQSGVTAIGLLLLKIVDPEYKTGTAEAFGLKQIIYEPFLGGGLITALSPFAIIYWGIWNSIFICFIIIIAFLCISIMNGWTKLNRNI